VPQAVERFLREGSSRAGPLGVSQILRSLSVVMPFGPSPVDTDRLRLAAPLAETHQQLLLRKVVKLIGREDLATHLGVPAYLLDGWIDGHATMPIHKLVLLVQVLDKISRSH
jgi:hypothetical protein